MGRHQPISRRNFLGRAGALAAGLTLPAAFDHPAASAAPPPPATPLDPANLTPFISPLSIPETLRSREMRPSPTDPAVKVPFYKLSLRELRQSVHRDLPPTRMWGFNTSSPGPILDTRGNHGVLVEWSNDLPAKHLFPVDRTLYGAGPDKPEVRCAIHLHGGRTPPRSDGFPEDWVVPSGSLLFHYPNRQDAATLFYRDQAIGIGRLNSYAGLHGLFLVRDDLEDSLNLPRGKYEIPLILCDRLLRSDGQLDYPVSSDPKSPWVPEVLGNVILANGMLLPFLNVEPRLYRLRILNASNSRLLNLTFGEISEMHQIGGDQGFLAAPIRVKALALAPAERADIVFDFSQYAGERLLLRSDSIDILQLRVSSTGTEDNSSLPETLRPIARIPESRAVRTRRLTLNDTSLEVSATPPDKIAPAMLLNNTPWRAPVTEDPVLDSTEIWEFVNLTRKAHPIHLRLVRFQLLDRRAFDVPLYRTRSELHFLAPASPPSPGEAGWKDTVLCGPGAVTRIVVPFESYAGRYLWQSQLLEYADNQMMRPLDVLPSAPPPRA